MIHVSTGGGWSGLYQLFGQVPHATFSVDVFVNYGKVMLGLYTFDGGLNLSQVTSSTIGEWETLYIPETHGSIAEAVLYSTGPALIQSGGADFYADSARSGLATPEPGALAAIAACAMAFGGLRLRRIRGC